MQIRTLRPTDTIPFSDLARGGLSPVGFEHLPLAPDWTWAAILDAQIIGLLVTVPANGLLMLFRISTTPTAPPLTPMLLLRRAFSDARRRGLLGYVTFLSDSAAAESKLMRIVYRAGGDLLPASGAWAYGKF